MLMSTLSPQTLARLRGAELSHISHALRTPITSIVGFADAILSDPHLAKEEKEEFARIIKAEGERLSKFVDELLYASYVSRDFDDPTQWDLGTAVSIAFHGVSIFAVSRSIALTHDVPSSCPPLTTEKEFVISMLSNILTNAIWHAPEQSAISVNASMTPKECEIRVHTRRVQAPSGTDAAHIGLARTKYALELHGASLDVQCEDNSETVVTMRLPVKTE